MLLVFYDILYITVLWKICYNADDIAITPLFISIF